MSWPEGRNVKIGKTPVTTYQIEVERGAIPYKNESYQICFEIPGKTTDQCGASFDLIPKGTDSYRPKNGQYTRWSEDNPADMDLKEFRKQTNVNPKKLAEEILRYENLW